MRLGKILFELYRVRILTVYRYDGLAYCTWNGLGRELSEDKILSALQDLSDNGIHGTSAKAAQKPVLTMRA